MRTAYNLADPLFRDVSGFREQQPISIIAKNLTRVPPPKSPKLFLIKKPNSYRTSTISMSMMPKLHMSADVSYGSREIT